MRWRRTGARAAPRLSARSSDPASTAQRRKDAEEHARDDRQRGGRETQVDRMALIRGTPSASTCSTLTAHHASTIAGVAIGAQALISGCGPRQRPRQRRDADPRSRVLGARERQVAWRTQQQHDPGRAEQHQHQDRSRADDVIAAADAALLSLFQTDASTGRATSDPLGLRCAAHAGLEPRNEGR